MEAFNRRDFEPFVNQYAPHSELIPVPGFDEGALALDIEASYRGPDGVRAFFRAWDESWATFEATPQAVIESGNEWLLLNQYRGVARGSGMELRQEGAHYYRWQGGQIVRAEFYGDQEQVLQAHPALRVG
jgi:ketosteroid isomerase-like protein